MAATHILLLLAIFAAMVFKRYMALFLLTVFLTARAQPALPYLKILPHLACNLLTSIYSADKKARTNVKITDQSDQDSKTDEKEGEKEAGKSVKEECKILPHADMAYLPFIQNTGGTAFHLHSCGKLRNHVDEIFRPPLV